MNRIEQQGNTHTIKENRIRHIQNLLILHGVYYKGRYFHYGEAKPKKEVKIYGKQA